MLSNAFLLNREHHTYIETGHGKLATVYWYDILLALGLVIFAIGLLRIDLTRNAVRDWQILNDRGVVETYDVVSRSSMTEFLRGTRTTVTFTSENAIRSFTGSRSAYGYTPEFDANGQEIVHVVVDPENVALMSLQSAMGFPFYEVGLTLILIVGSSILVFISGRELYYRWQLSRHGELIAGHIVDVLKLRGENRLVFKIDYTFPSPDGERILHGRSTHVRRTLENRPLPQKGMPVAVLYLDNKHHEAL